jgi:hypothetical protein
MQVSLASAETNGVVAMNEAVVSHLLHAHHRIYGNNKGFLAYVKTTTPENGLNPVARINEQSSEWRPLNMQVARKIYATYTS